VGTTNGLNFDGISDIDGVAPPDTNASVGATQVVEIVNTSYQVFNKSTGQSVFGPEEVSSIWTGFGGDCGLGLFGFYSDPVVLYDKAASRWLVTIIGSSDGFATGTECVAVSTTSDATGAYYRYAFSFAPGHVCHDAPRGRGCSWCDGLHQEEFRGRRVYTLLRGPVRAWWRSSNPSG
jgi:hypothetical protein